MAALRQLRASAHPNNLLAAPVFSTWVDSRALAANVNESHTVPTGAKYVVIGTSADLYIEPGGTAAVVASDVTDGTASIYVPAGSGRMFALDDVTSIGLISAATCLVSLEFYS